MKKSNLYSMGITLNLFQLLLCLGVMGVKMLDVLGDFYVRISVFALELLMWILISMYLFIKHDFVGTKKAFGAAILSILPVLILTTGSALLGYLGDVSKADWLSFAFFGSSVSFYNKPAVILTDIIPIADGYLMFFANYAMMFISSFIGCLMGSAMNKKIRKAKDSAEEVKAETPAEDMSMTRILEKIDEKALEGISEESDDELSEVVLDEEIVPEDEDTTTALISIDDDDDDSEILGQETVEIISLDVDELEDEAENQLKNRYNDMNPEEGSEEEISDAVSEEETAEIEEENTEPAEEDMEELPEEAVFIEEDSFVVDQLYEEDIEEDDEMSFEEMMDFIDENVTSENGWTFLSEEESDELLRLAKEISVEDISGDEFFDEEDIPEENESISFDEMINIIMQEDLSEEYADEEISVDEEDVFVENDENDYEGIEFDEDIEEKYSEEEIAEAEEIKEYIDEYDTVISQAEDYGIAEDFLDPFIEEIPEETTRTEEIEVSEPKEEIVKAEESDETDDDIAQIIEVINEDITQESYDNEDGISEEVLIEDSFAVAAEEIVEDFSDITLEDIENYVDIQIDEDDVVFGFDVTDETASFEDITDEEYIDIDENVVVDFDIDEILMDGIDEDIPLDEDDIDENELKDLIRNGEESSDQYIEDITADDITEMIPSDIPQKEEKDDLSVIADYVRSVSDKEVKVFEVVMAEPEKPKVKVKTQKDIKEQRDKEFDNWLNRKTARLDVKAIREALKESEEE